MKMQSWQDASQVILPTRCPLKKWSEDIFDVHHFQVNPAILGPQVAKAHVIIIIIGVFGRVSYTYCQFPTMAPFISPVYLTSWYIDNLI